MGEESKFSPNIGAMDVENMEGAGKAAKNLADRRFDAFEVDVQVIIDMRMLDKENHKLLKVRGHSDPSGGDVLCEA